ncbi:MAG: hypothetical protein II445_04395, partial [Muribaculaceae bacterium]|nr:hypothetical protein [Muribaculaceae bacterium]
DTVAMMDILFETIAYEIGGNYFGFSNGFNALFYTLGNEVVGMVTMGRTAVDAPHLPPLNRRMEQNTCWAFKTSYIKRFLPRLR